MENNEYRIMFDLENSYWWFLGKQFLVKNALKTLGLDAAAGERILDLGCGTGIILKVLEDYGVSYGVELSREAISFLRKRNLNRITCTDVNGRLPFKDNSFSLVTCLDVLEHLDRDRDLVVEMFRVVKPGGYVFITVPAFNFFWSPHDTALHHRRRYVRRQLLGHVRSVKGKVIKASYYNMFLSLPIAAVRKFRALYEEAKEARSDFFLSLPDPVNKLLSVLFKLEIFFLNFVNYPFGVSLLVIARKGEEEIGSKSS
jgi:SAM-dependent methyltransferase